MTDYSPEGGIYASPIGAVGLDATGRELSITVLDYPADSPQALDAAASVARWLLTAADPDSEEKNPTLQRIVGAVLTPEPDVLAIDLSRTHVRPEALLQDVLLSECNLAPPYGAFKATVADDDTLQLEALTTGSMVAAVDERLITSDDEALIALTRGDVDLLARVPPWQVEAFAVKSRDSGRAVSIAYRTCADS